MKNICERLLLTKDTSEQEARIIGTIFEIIFKHKYLVLKTADTKLWFPLLGEIRYFVICHIHTFVQNSNIKHSNFITRPQPTVNKVITPCHWYNNIWINLNSNSFYLYFFFKLKLMCYFHFLNFSLVTWQITETAMTCYK